MFDIFYSNLTINVTVLEELSCKKSYDKTLFLQNLLIYVYGVYTYGKLINGRIFSTTNN